MSEHTILLRDCANLLFGALPFVIVLKVSFVIKASVFAIRTLCIVARIQDVHHELHVIHLDRRRQDVVLFCVRLHVTAQRVKIAYQVNAKSPQLPYIAVMKPPSVL